MIPQAQSSILITRDSLPAAVVVYGQNCAEHARPMTPFAEYLGFSDPLGSGARGLRRAIRPNAWFRPKVSLITTVGGSKVLGLGPQARSRPRGFVITETPARSTIALGSIQRASAGVDQTPFEAPKQILAIAYDAQSVFLGGSSLIAVGIVHWLADLFATGDACFVQAHRRIAFCDRRAAQDLDEECRITDHMPSGYARVIFDSHLDHQIEAA